MQKKYLSLFLIVFGTSAAFCQLESAYIEGATQGTSYHITYLDTKHRNLQPEIEKLLVNFDFSVSTYNPFSIITRVNQNDKVVRVDKYFKACFKKAKEVWKNTEGAFDPTVLPLTNAWGFGPGRKLTIQKNKIDSILQFVGFQLIKLKGNKIVKEDPRVELDFNAFAQGYSVDVVSNFLNKKGIKSYIVEIGGEVYAKGTNLNDKAWTVNLEQPKDNKESINNFIASAILKNCAISTSGNNRRFFIENGIKYAHHLDPKTGYPAKNNLLSASLFANNCITTDANATGVLVMGLDKAKIFLQKHPEIKALLIYSDESGNYNYYKANGVDKILIDFKE